MEQYHDVLPSSMVVPVPGVIFGPVLEEIHDVVGLKCVLRIFFLLHRNRSNNGFIEMREVLGDSVLSKALEGNTKDQKRKIIGRVVELAVAHGILLTQTIQTAGEKEIRLYLNSLANRKMTDSVQDEIRSNQPLPVLSVTECSSSGTNVFQLYEELIGIITPMAAERLKDLEKEYSAMSIQEAFRTAASQDKRRLAYVEAILRSGKESDRRNGARGRRPEKVSIMEIFRHSRE